MDTNVKDRLMLFIKSQGVSVNRFEKMCGFSTGYVANMRKSLQPDKIKSIVQNFPDLNTGWLMTGEGQMLIDGKAVTPVDANSSEEDSKELQMLAKLVNSLQDTVATQKALINIYEAEIKRLQRAVQFKESGKRAASALPDSEEF